MDVLEQSPEADRRWIDAFVEAKARWEEVLIGDIPSGVIPMVADPRAIPVCTELPAVIDDIYICVTDPPMDGVGGVLAGAGPVLRRADSDLPITGIMIFDRFDIDIAREAGYFADVVLHEMGHVFGIGALWESEGLIDAFAATYLGPAAIAEWEAMGCTGPLRIEDNFGPGTALSHWDEECMDSELMTGISEIGLQEEFMSRITVGTLEDIGYEVDYSRADNYTIDLINPFCCNANNNLRRKTQRKKSISSKGLEKARAYGRQKLSEINGMISQEHRAQLEADNDGIIVGLPYFSVLYQEGNHIFTVVVDDLNDDNK